MTSKPRPCR